MSSSVHHLNTLVTSSISHPSSPCPKLSSFAVISFLQLQVTDGQCVKGIIFMTMHSCVQEWLWSWEIKLKRKSTEGDGSKRVKELLKIMRKSVLKPLSPFIAKGVREASINHLPHSRLLLSSPMQQFLPCLPVSTLEYCMFIFYKTTWENCLVVMEGRLW